MILHIFKIQFMNHPLCEIFQDISQVSQLYLYFPIILLKDLYLVTW